MDSWCLPLYRYMVFMVISLSFYLSLSLSLFLSLPLSLLSPFFIFIVLTSEVAALLLLQVWNGAGISTIISSLGHTHDSTPPHPGIVYDGSLQWPPQDSHHTTSLSEISAHWAGFSDPHTPIVGYYWAIGSCGFCDDVQDFIYLGIATGRLIGANYRI